MKMTRAVSFVRSLPTVFFFLFIHHRMAISCLIMLGFIVAVLLVFLIFLRNDLQKRFRLQGQLIDRQGQLQVVQLRWFTANRLNFFPQLA